MLCLEYQFSCQSMVQSFIRFHITDIIRILNVRTGDQIFAVRVRNTIHLMTIWMIFKKFTSGLCFITLSMNAIEKIVRLQVIHSVETIILLSLLAIKSFGLFFMPRFPIWWPNIPFLWFDCELAFGRYSDEFVSADTMGLSPRDLVQ